MSYGTKFPEFFAALSTPFAGKEVRTRQAGNRPVDYVTARTVMNRLDQVVGPENWTEEYTPLQNGVLCRLTIRLPDGSQVTKSDAGGHAGMSDEGDDEKSAFSDAFKRAAVKFGIGRHLYGEGTPRYSPSEAPRVRKEAPALPPPAILQSKPCEASTASPGRLPETGREFYLWLQRQPIQVREQAAALSAEYLHPKRYIDWNRQEVSRMLEELHRSHRVGLVVG